MKATKIKMFDGSIGLIVEDENTKSLVHPKYNFRFRKSDGLFVRWGSTKEDDGDLTLGLPEICDMEISEVCSQGCAFCYKSNLKKGKNMSFETFKKIFHKLPIDTITQIAYGIGDIDGNPDMWQIFEYSKNHGITPNVTINGSRMKPEYYDKLVKLCGAVAVSNYNKDICYNAVKELSVRGLKQVNIHQLLSEETYEQAKNLLIDKLKDPRLQHLNAIVFLSLKTKGRALDNNFKKLSQIKYDHIVNFGLQNNIGIGFDSCGASKFLTSIKNNPEYKQLKNYAEPCESSIYSVYLDVNGLVYPCSFTPKTEEWQNGISIIECNDFIRDIWFSDKFRKFHNNVVNCRNNCGCPIYDI